MASLQRISYSVNTVLIVLGGAVAAFAVSFAAAHKRATDELIVVRRCALSDFNLNWVVCASLQSARNHWCCLKVIVTPEGVRCHDAVQRNVQKRPGYSLAHAAPCCDVRLAVVP